MAVVSIPRMLPPCVVALSLLVAPAAAQNAGAPLAADLGARVAETYVRPAVAGFVSEAGALSATLEALCAAPDTAGLEAARADFSDLVAAWGRLSILRFGPLASDDRFERIFFWPDPRGVTLRQVQALLAAKDESALTPEALAGKSVALQGLPALEFVLFGEGSDALAAREAGYACGYGRAIAAGLAATGARVAQGWDAASSFAASFETPAPDGNPYRSPGEVAGEIVKALATGVQFVVNAELRPALGDSIGKASGRRAPLRRSDLTFMLVEAQLAGLGDLLAATGWPSLPGDVGPVAGNVGFDLENARAAIASIDGPAEAAFEVQESREKLRYVTVALDYAGHTVSERLAGTLGLAMGFNALDGD